jgi:hypothetical protein
MIICDVRQLIALLPQVEGAPAPVVDVQLKGGKSRSDLGDAAAAITTGRTMSAKSPRRTIVNLTFSSKIGSDREPPWP